MEPKKEQAESSPVERVFKCPACGEENTDSWPIHVNGEVVDGGCQKCWENDCDHLWWEQVRAIEVMHEKGV